jgi:hypothetical protein
LRQKIKVGIGIVLNAISGPDEPIPMIPTPNRSKSDLPGISVTAVLTLKRSEVEAMMQT